MANGMAKKLSSNKSISNPYYLESLHALQNKSPLFKALLALQPPPSQKKSQKLPCKKKKNLLSIIQSSNAKVCLFYGFSTCLIQNLFSWLTQELDRQILFFIDDLWEFKSALYTKNGLLLAQHSQIHFFYLNNTDFWTQHEKKIKSYLGMPFEIFNLKKDAQFGPFQEKITQLCLSQNSLFSEYLFTSSLVYQNIFNNFQLALQSINTSNLKNHFLNIPAIICGAGPSINSDLDQLKSLSQKALIFAGGRALEVLSQNRVEPHFTVGIDPYEMHHQTFSQNCFFETPLIYRLRMNYNACEKAHGPTLYTPQAIGYPLVQWLEEKLHLTSHFFEEGLNVVNFSVQLAYFFGCNPIILTGCDLAYQGQMPYSPSIVLNQKLPPTNLINKNDYSIHRGVFKQNSQGQKVYTLWKWVEEAHWLSEFTQKHSDRFYYNTTPAGLQISGFINMDLKNLSQKQLIHEYDVTSLIHQSISLQPPIKFSKHQFLSLKKDFLKSLSRCKQLLKQYIENHPAPYLFLEENLKQEIAYQKALLILDELFESVEHEKEVHQRQTKKALFLLTMVDKYLTTLHQSA